MYLSIYLSKYKKDSCVQDKIERLNSGSFTGTDSSPRKVLLEQLSKTLPADDVLPEQV